METNSQRTFKERFGSVRENEGNIRTYFGLLLQRTHFPLPFALLFAFIFGHSPGESRLKPADIKLLLDSIDSDNDGTISYDEFITATIVRTLFSSRLVRDSTLRDLLDCSRVFMKRVCVSSSLLACLLSCLPV
jgi:hypothetical protein